jgi:hypothetical protein
VLAEARYYAGMTLGIYRLLRAPVHGQPEAVLRWQLERRGETFLETIERAIFSRRHHPYARMFHLAGCTAGDLAQTVRRDGLEAALTKIHSAGVYLSHDEFKGKTPVIRSGQHIPSSPASFLNPLISGWIETRSSGSRSRGTRTPQSTACRQYREIYQMLIDRELCLDGRVRVELKPILPAGSGLFPCLRGARLGRPVERWFAVGGGLQDSGHYRLATRCMVSFANLLGARAPQPTYLPENDFSPVAAHIARRRSGGARCVLSGFVSPVTRVAAAALEKGLDISGAVAQVGGEALTDHKRAVIEQAGAEVYPNYWINEVGPIGHACRRMRTGNSVHVFSDSVAVIGHRRAAPLSDVPVDSLLFTTLLPYSPWLFINAEMDDSGIMEPARCDCLFSRLGLTSSIHNIFSFGKLTGQGMTLIGTDLVRIIEETLPARFGGRPGDYQLIEQDSASQTQLILVVSPRVGLVATEGVRECFLTEVRRYYGGALASRTWRHAQAIQVRIQEPFSTSTGKVLSLHLLGGAKQSPHHATQKSPDHPA